MNYKEPDLSFIPLSYFNNVYEPSEDTYIFLDSITDEVDYILNIFNNTEERNNENDRDQYNIVEIGTGSGILLTHLSKLLQLNNINIKSIGTDINPYAIELANLTLKNNGVYNLLLYFILLLFYFRLIIIILYKHRS